MEQPPADLLALLSEDEKPHAQFWWDTLPAADRRRVAGLWDERLEVCFFAPQADESGRLDGWEQVPAVRGGQFVPAADDQRSDWITGYFEYLLQHPELVLLYDPSHRRFHIGCNRHAAARACLSVGRVPGDFVCPRGAADCPLTPLRGASLVRRRHAAQDDR
ncbi:hypothetical protein R5W23_005514 [Gemmata sp. JC673]|uniref:GNAT family N-acetyltransferase n=1 Tax=Gemmata algarum TaxID=2975278 RepID=A0ABU5EVM6_9BACT|nr:hypothetical protein [Gemmata algarum]MDY3557863.1 hypothetical protein [Gemmata algarum]